MVMRPLTLIRSRVMKSPAALIPLMNPGNSSPTCQRRGGGGGGGLRCQTTGQMFGRKREVVKNGKLKSGIQI